jgi:hypothetical protein
MNSGHIKMTMAKWDVLQVYMVYAAPPTVLKRRRAAADKMSTV